MSAPAIVQDNLYCVLSPANNFSIDIQLSVPIVNKKRCRVLANNSALITTNFTRDTYILNGNFPQVTKIPGLIYTGDDQTWFDLKDPFIKNPVVSLFSEVLFDSLQINFQFI